MHSRGRTLKFTAVLAMVVLALTGFSTGRGHGGSRHSGGGGGGCSSSSQNHDSSSSTSGGGSYSSGSTTSGSGGDDDYYDSDDDDDAYGSGSTGSSSTGGYNRRPTHRSTSGSGSKGPKDGTARLVSCATERAPYATVEVTNPNSRKVTFRADVTFYDENDLPIPVTRGYGRVTVPANGKDTVRVEVGGSGLAASVDHCEVSRTAPAED
ncbi:hypothetical protein [Streptomyces sp. NPDC005301]|uniref:hypothetical protein n=1 Tax=unclassified Streptomyces TaxID=2593676 RepID=UPI0033BD1B0D